MMSQENIRPAQLDEPSDKILITGCGRSGTKYIATVLNHLGLDIGHELLRADGIASWLMTADCREAPYGVGRSGLSFGTILHQVRHPLRAIPSLTTFTEPSWKFISRHIPCSPHDPIIRRAALYWYYWNLKAEQIAEWTYPIEALPQLFGEFCQRLGVRPIGRVLETRSTMVNSRKIRRSTRVIRLALDHCGGVCHSSRLFDFTFNRNARYVDQPFTWERLASHVPDVYEKIRELSRRYGYESDADADATVESDCA